MAARKRDFYIVHQDKLLIVVDKPAGLLAVPIPKGKAKNLYHLIQEHLGKHGVRVGTVHRIDRYTSGLMVFSKRHRAYQHLRRQFEEHKAERTYWAIVRGNPEAEEGKLVHHLKRIQEGFRNVVVSPDDPEGTPARLEYKVLEQLPGAAVVEVKLDTGLKNQIRVQFEEWGHPIIGDQHYAPKEKKEPLIDRQALHAWKLGFEHPGTHQFVEYEARIPGDLKHVLHAFRNRRS